MDKNLIILVNNQLDFMGKISALEFEVLKKEILSDTDKYGQGKITGGIESVDIIGYFNDGKFVMYIAYDKKNDLVKFFDTIKDSCPPFLDINIFNNILSSLGLYECMI